MKKALVVATTTSFITSFEMSDISILHDFGYEIHSASNKNINYKDDIDIKLNALGVIQHQVDFARSPFDKTNIKAYRQLEKIIKENMIELIHCHTPVGGILARLIAKKYKNIKVIYTAHGFHFFKGNNPIKNFIFRTIEKYCAKFTDILITINNEDYQAAKKFKLRKNGSVYKINGVGINIDKFIKISVNKNEKRNELGITEKDIMLLSIGELNENKNHSTVIKALSIINNPKMHYFIAGVGEYKEILENLAKELNILDRVHLIGYRKDIIELLKTADIFIFPSYREGLSVALMEAMACGLPVIASKIRGNVDLIEDNKGGILLSPYHTIEFKEVFLKYIDNPNLFKEFGEHNLNAIKEYDIENVAFKMREIYLDIGKKERKC